MDSPLNVLNSGGITFEHDHDEYGLERVTISGVDRDVVANRALEVMSAAPSGICLEVIGPLRDVGSGRWRATVRAQREQSGRNASVVEYERLESLTLPNRVENRLRADGMWFIYELCERSESDLRKLPGVGTTSIRCIRDALAKRGLVLAQ